MLLTFLTLRFTNNDKKVLKTKRVYAITRIICQITGIKPSHLCHKREKNKIIVLNSEHPRYAKNTGFMVCFFFMAMIIICVRMGKSE